jgi:hypothetical protein
MNHSSCKVAVDRQGAVSLQGESGEAGAWRFQYVLGGRDGARSGRWQRPGRCRSPACWPLRCFRVQRAHAYGTVLLAGSVGSLVAVLVYMRLLRQSMAPPSRTLSRRG